MPAAATPDTRLPIGTLVDGRFELCELLGSGGFGDVYRARQLLFGRPVREVALKVFKQRHVSAANAAKVFADAITLLGLIEDDPPPEVARRLVQVYDLGLTRSPDGRGYIAMRLVPGRRSLAGELRRFAGKGMPVQTSLWFLRRLLVPLAWLHRQDAALVHGDIKPENVLIAPDGDLVLSDFGLAARLPLGAVGGTLAYQAPEVLLQGTGTPSSDIYSLGVVWYEMLAGRAPFDGVGLEALAAGDEAGSRAAHHESRKRLLQPGGGWAHGDGAIPSPAAFNPDLHEHPQIEALLARCLAYRSSQRLATGGALLAELDRYAASGAVSSHLLGEPAAPPTAEPAPAPKTLAARVHDALAVLAAGNAERALTLVLALLDSHPGHAPALVVQAQALIALDRLDEARRLIGLAVGRHPGDATLVDAYADVTEACGQAAMAAALRRQAQQLRAGTTPRSRP